MIDAITGGADRVKEINRKLAAVAGRAGVALAVGSQYGSVREGQHADTFAVIREENPDGIFFANVSALATPEEARAAVDMIQASCRGYDSGRRPGDPSECDPGTDYAGGRQTVFPDPG